MASFLEGREEEVVSDEDRRLSLFFSNITNSTERERKGIVFDKWPFRLDIEVEYQDWILVGACGVVLGLWCLPCICGQLHNGISRAFTKWVYTRLTCFFWTITYVNLILMMFVIGVLPDWTVNEFVYWLVLFITWILVHLKKMITSAAILAGFALLLKFRERIAIAAGLEHMTMIRFSWRDVLPGMNGRKRPIELFLWKIEDLQAPAGKAYKASDIFVECHLGDNEPMRTRVHNNAGTSCVVKESFQMNINESDTSSLMTLLVKDQGMLTGTEMARLMLSTRELCGIEDQTGKRRVGFTYSNESFVQCTLMPRGKIYIAIAPVEENDEETAPLMSNADDDSLVTC